MAGNASIGYQRVSLNERLGLEEPTGYMRYCSWLIPAKPTRGIESAKRLLKFLDKVPEEYKTGPWSPVAHYVLVSFSAFLLMTMYHAIESYSNPDYSGSSHFDWLQSYRFYGALWGILTTSLTVYFVGAWPLASYTLTSWNLMTVRLLTAYLAGAGFKSMELVANLVRFPALIGCTITVLVWWMVLVPLITALLWTDRTGFWFFWKWNLSGPLLNVHLLNLPLVGIEYLSSLHHMSYFDLWMGLTVALVYVLFYLNVLDARGLHFYIVFTPRTPLCFISYLALILLYIFLFYVWNFALFVTQLVLSNVEHY